MQAPTTWTVEKAADRMRQLDLSMDMLPVYNESEQSWEICLSDERGNEFDCIRFATEEEAEAFSVALGEELFGPE